MQTCCELRRLQEIPLPGPCRKSHCLGPAGNLIASGLHAAIPSTTQWNESGITKYWHFAVDSWNRHSTGVEMSSPTYMQNVNISLDVCSIITFLSSRQESWDVSSHLSCAPVLRCHQLRQTCKTSLFHVRNSCLNELCRHVFSEVTELQLWCKVASWTHVIIHQNIIFVIEIMTYCIYVWWRAPHNSSRATSQRTSRRTSRRTS